MARIISLIAVAVLALAACGKKETGGDVEPAKADTEAAAAETSDINDSTAEDAAAQAPEASIPSGETGGMCAGIAGIQCLNASDYCAMEAGVCVDIADASGICTAKPEACTMEYAPVCGCDGKTYPNACGAASAGTNVATQGECPPA